MLDQIIASVFEKASSLLSAGDGQGAVQVLSPLLPLAPSEPDLHFLLGIGYSMCKQYGRAVECFDKVISLVPLNTNAWINKGIALRKHGEAPKAVRCFDKAIEINPNSSEAHCGKANALSDMGEIENAIGCYEKSIDIEPFNPDAYNNLGLMYTRLALYDQSIAAYQKSISMQPENPEAHNNLGMLYADLQQFDRAFVSYSKALELNPRNAEALNNMGLLYANLRQFDLALANYGKALALNPEGANITLNRSLALLSVGRYLDGWHDYESRLKQTSFSAKFDKPSLRKGEDLRNKVVLVCAEQGYGDTLQFCRYVDMLANFCHQVVLRVPKEMVAICSTLISKPVVISDEGQLPNFDVYCFLMSLPFLLGTTIETIPANIPYLYSDSKKTDFWRGKLSSISALKVGLVWSGGVHLDKTREWSKINPRRNISLESLGALQMAGVQLISLQKDEKALAELYKLKRPSGSNSEILDCSHDLINYTDTAALIENLDLIISVDTSVAHLAGALGKPVWILNRYDSCWRWFIDRSDSPWYPTAKIYNQPEMGDWGSVINSVNTDLQQLVASRHLP